MARPKSNKPKHHFATRRDFTMSIQTYDWLSKMSEMFEVSRSNILERAFWFWLNDYFGAPIPPRYEGLPPSMIDLSKENLGLPPGVELPEGLYTLIRLLEEDTGRKLLTDNFSPD
jgi:hypothetical protein